MKRGTVLAKKTTLEGNFSMNYSEAGTIAFLIGSSQQKDNEVKDLEAEIENIKAAYNAQLSKDSIMAR